MGSPLSDESRCRLKPELEGAVQMDRFFRDLHHEFISDISQFPRELQFLGTQPLVFNCSGLGKRLILVCMEGKLTIDPADDGDSESIQGLEPVGQTSTPDPTEPATFASKETEALLETLYTELHDMAAGKIAGDQVSPTMQPTALVHEAWLRVGRQKFENKAHFFGSAAEAMRRILVERARRRGRQKRGGGMAPLTFEESEIPSPIEDSKLLAVNEVLDEYESEDPEKAAIVKLRYFAGLSNAEIARLFDISEKTVWRHWKVARIRLYQMLSEG
jgi:RNA polymerase sigma factor (TIGR02999 family)